MQSIQSKPDELLRVWEKIQIFVGDDGERGQYEARVEDFINGGIIISNPVFVQGHTLLRENVPVIVCFTREDAAYQFHSRIRRRLLKGDARMLLAPARNIQRVQRRRFFRIRTSAVVSYARLVPMLDWDNWEDCLTWEESQCVDISGGGVLIRTNEKLDDKTLLLMRLEFFRRHDLPELVVGICRRTFERESGHFAGLEFVVASRLHDYIDKKTLSRLPAAIRIFDNIVVNKLVSAVFREQVELRQKGVL
ncbi:MAG TPA: flagellar brake protein [Acidobacteriota bacterium]|nr:flagellar brake protein [Acidobacteriota bacterium]